MPGEYVKVGDILTCYCDTPLAKRVSKDVFQIMRFHRGEKVVVDVLHGGEGTHIIGCPTCGYKYATVGIIDIIGISDDVNVQ